MKRFYKTAGVAERDAGWSVTLDGRPVQTPARRPLIVPKRGLAEAVAAEWDAQGETVDPGSMAMMALATTAIDRVTPQRDHVVDQIAKYAETDLLCYRIETPADLAARQADTWQPLLDWCRVTHDAPLAVTAGVMPLRQEPSALAAVRAAVDAHDDWELAALHGYTTVLGSVVLALAISAGRLGPEAGFAASQIDETYQAEQWGEEAEATTRRGAMRTEILATARFLALVRG